MPQVLNGAVSGKELGGEVVVAHPAVGAGKRVAKETEGAGPDLGWVVHAGVWVEDTAAAGAGEGIVREDGEIRERHQRGAHEAERDHEGRSLRLGGGPRVPRPPQALDRFELQEIHRLRGSPLW